MLSFTHIDHTQFQSDARRNTMMAIPVREREARGGGDDNDDSGKGKRSKNGDNDDNSGKGTGGKKDDDDARRLTTMTILVRKGRKEGRQQ